MSRNFFSSAEEVIKNVFDAEILIALIEYHKIYKVQNRFGLRKI